MRVRRYDVLVPLIVHSEEVSGATGREKTILDMVRCTLTLKWYNSCFQALTQLVLSSKSGVNTQGYCGCVGKCVLGFFYCGTCIT